MNNYYVYVYLNPLKPGKFKYLNFKFDFEPFYVGEGKNNRFKNHLNENIKKNCNKHKIRTINNIKSKSLKPIIIKVLKDVSKKEAQLLEVKLIKLIGRRQLNTGPLTNLTNGGDGTSGSIRTNEMKLHQSKKQKGCTAKYKYTEEVANKFRNTRRNKKLNECILQYDLNGIFIKEWDNLQSIRDNFKSPSKIKRCCTSNNKGYFLKSNSKFILYPYHSVYNYIWIWSNGCISKTISTEILLINKLKITDINNNISIISTLKELKLYNLYNGRFLKKLKTSNIIKHRNLKIEKL